MLFLSTFDKKRHCTWYCWNPLVIIQYWINCFNNHSICYLFLHSRGHIHMKCLLVYLDTESIYTISRGYKKNLKRLLTLLYVHSCHITFSESYYGLQNVTTLLLWYNKILMKEYICISTSFTVWFMKYCLSSGVYMSEWNILSLLQWHNNMQPSTTLAKHYSHQVCNSNVQINLKKHICVAYLLNESSVSVRQVIII